MQSLRVNVKQVLILESQFYVLLVNFRNSLYALRCVHNVFFFSIQLCVFVIGVIFYSLFMIAGMLQTRQVTE